MPPPPRYPLYVYYDGACRVCAAEIAHYLRRDRRSRLIGVDISAPGFDAAPLGLSRDELMAQLHAVDADGKIYRNVAAFRAIWLAFPAPSPYPLLAGLLALPLIAPLARCAYRVFARYRHHLPRRTACSGDACRPGAGHPP